jgi:uncharacterized membrane protein YbjE (DUF340 family)
MLNVIIAMSLGIASGFLIRRRTWLLKINEKLITGVIYLLLFLLGIPIGANETIIKNLLTLGLNASLVAFGGIAGSALLAWLTYRYFFKHHEESEG